MDQKQFQRDSPSLQVIPLYQKGSRFQPTTVEMVDGETSPPLLLTEADLIALMEKHGIGQYWAAWPLALGRGNSPQGILQMLLQIRNHLNVQNKGI